MIGNHPAFADWRAGRPRTQSGPAIVAIHSTSRCNLSCFMCWHGMVDEIPVTFTPAQLRPLLDTAWGTLFTGAEPMWITKNVNVPGGAILDDILSNHQHLRLHTLSNGVMLKGKMLKMVMDRFEQVCFSVDSVDPGVYAKVRGLPLVAAVLKNMKALHEAKKADGRGRHDAPRIEINSTVMRATLDGLPAVAEALWECGGEAHSLTALQEILDEEFRFYRTDEYVDALGGSAAQAVKSRHALAVQSEVLTAADLRTERFARVRETLLKFYAETGLKMQDKGHLFRPWETPSPAQAAAVCPMPWIYATVVRNGDVVCCSTNSVVLGNLHRNTVDEIWNGPAARGLRTSFLKGEMAGCFKSACNAELDHFNVAERFSRRFRETFPPDGAGSGPVLFLRTAPLLQSHLAVKALKEAMPGRPIHVVTRPDDAGSEAALWEGCTEHVFHGERITAACLRDILRVVVRPSLAVFVSAHSQKRGYENVESAVREIPAEGAGWVGPDGGFSRLQ